VLKGARHITLTGSRAYVSADAGVVVLDLQDPMKPRVEATIPLRDVRSTAVQFRYLFAVTGAGLQTVDVTKPAQPRVIDGALVPLADAHKVHLARTYAYVAAGKDGVAIVDIEKPEQPKLFQRYDADGRLKDVRDVAVGSTNASLFAYVADARNGLHVIQLTAPDTQPKFYGFSPEPRPVWIAHRNTGKPALALSKGLERDRAVDETGGQIAIFGRIGSRPFNVDEMAKLYMKDGEPWFVSNQFNAQANKAAQKKDTEKKRSGKKSEKRRP
jgi:hypothetical protein